jgi:hypothetical protein
MRKLSEGFASGLRAAAQIKPPARADGGVIIRAEDIDDDMEETVDERLEERTAFEVEDLMRAGLFADAERRIECFESPKFSSVESCREAYDKAMAATRSARQP